MEFTLVQPKRGGDGAYLDKLRKLTSRQRENELSSLHNRLRSDSLAFSKCKGDVDSLSENRLFDVTDKISSVYDKGGVRLEGSPYYGIVEGDKERWSNLRPNEKGILATLQYMEERFRGCNSAIVADEPTFLYNIYSDLDRPTVRGENTVGLEIDFEWTLENIQAEMYAHKGRVTALNPDMSKAMQAGFVDKKTIMAGAGFTPDEMRQMGGGLRDQLKSVLNLGSNGQSKITRLVKGVLLCLDLEAQEMPINVGFMMNTLEYNLANVVGGYNRRGAAYVFSDVSSSAAYNAFIYMMAQGYPNANVLGMGHITIPADGEVYLVTMGAVPARVNATLTPQIAWGCLVKYASSVGVLDDLDEAIVIACSLRANRYFTRCGLPLVVSYDELIRPCLSRAESALASKSWLTMDMAKLVGRVHQMQAFIVVKDMCVGALKNTVGGGNWMDTVQAYLRAQEDRFLAIGTENYELKLLEIGGSLKWLSYLDIGDIQSLMDTSAFEGLWTLDGCKNVTENGIISILRNGRKDNLNQRNVVGVHRDDMETLRNEVLIGGIVFADNRIQMGTFSVECAGIRSARRGIRRRAFTTVSVVVARLPDTKEVAAMVKGKGKNRKINASNKALTKNDTTDDQIFGKETMEREDRRQNESEADVRPSFNWGSVSLVGRIPTVDKREKKIRLEREVAVARHLEEQQAKKHEEEQKENNRREEEERKRRKEEQDECNRREEENRERLKEIDAIAKIDEEATEVELASPEIFERGYGELYYRAVSVDPELKRTSLEDLKRWLLLRSHITSTDANVLNIRQVDGVDRKLRLLYVHANKRLIKKNDQLLNKIGEGEDMVVEGSEYSGELDERLARYWIYCLGSKPMKKWFSDNHLERQEDVMSAIQIDPEWARYPHVLRMLIDIAKFYDFSYDWSRIRVVEGGTVFNELINCKAGTEFGPRQSTSLTRSEPSAAETARAGLLLRLAVRYQRIVTKPGYLQRLMRTFDVGKHFGELQKVFVLYGEK